MVGALDGDAVGAAGGDVDTALVVVGTADTGAGVAGGEPVAVVAVTDVLVMMVLVNTMFIGASVGGAVMGMLGDVVGAADDVGTADTGAGVFADAVLHTPQPGHAAVAGCPESLSASTAQYLLLGLSTSYEAHRVPYCDLQVSVLAQSPSRVGALVGDAVGAAIGDVVGTAVAAPNYKVQKVGMYVCVCVCVWCLY
jgi:hypothetical protein